MPSTSTIRSATAEDTSLILGFIRDLAAYEKLSHEVTATEDDLRRNLFGENSVAEALLLFEGKNPAGFAVFFHNFSTFLGKPGIYLEDLFVHPLYRKKGYGKALLTHLAALAIERGCGRFEWSVLDWNQPSIDFYRGLGARPMEDWTVFRLDGDALEALGRSTKAIH
ncbi:MAG: GNAT family N-acetyltransferase [Opitutaceae bacterium]